MASPDLPLTPSLETPWQLELGDGATVDVVSVEALHHALDTAHPGPGAVPWAVTVYPTSEPWPSMTICVGDALSVVCWDRSDEDKAISLSSPDAEPGESGQEREYRCAGDWQQWPVENLVPAETAREALDEWLRTGTRPGNVEWEEL